MSITPDTKDWTQVLSTPCTECGFDAAQVDLQASSSELRRTAARWVGILADEQAARRRPAPDVWSPLEYACHVRDVVTVFDGRVLRLLTEDEPRFANWDQNVTAIEDDYAAQQPADVATDLAAYAERLALRLSEVRENDWQRAGLRSDGAVLTVAAVARLLNHEMRHHLYDVTGSVPAQA